MKTVLDSKEFWKTMRPFLSDKNTVFSQVGIEKINRVISDNFDLSGDLALSLKMLLGRSVSSQMNII